MDFSSLKKKKATNKAIKN